jgi:hypothetical protein
MLSPSPPKVSKGNKGEEGIKGEGDVGTIMIETLHMHI